MTLVPAVRRTIGPLSPRFVTKPFDCYYIDMTYTNGALTGGTLITTSDTPLPLYVKMRWDTVHGFIVKEERRLYMWARGAPYAAFDWSNYNQFVQMFYPEIDVSDWLAETDALPANEDELRTSGNLRSGLLRDAYNATFAWNNLPTLHNEANVARLSAEWNPWVNATSTSRQIGFENISHAMKHFEFRDLAEDFDWEHGINLDKYWYGLALYIDTPAVAGSGDYKDRDVTLTFGDYWVGGMAESWIFPENGWFHFWDRPS